MPAAILLEERRVNVGNSGLMILTHEGQRSAEAIILFAGRQPRQLTARLAGCARRFIKTYEKSSIADLGAFDEIELYNDVRFERRNRAN